PGGVGGPPARTSPLRPHPAFGHLLPMGRRRSSRQGERGLPAMDPARFRAPFSPPGGEKVPRRSG
ncbi:MAG: hypothetical protein O9972_58765, partial [Burkholderiales bacterium]|nr:hypothetical protein [Burkholderiales bacterium]